MFKITDVTIKKIEYSKDKKLVGLGRVVIDNCFVIEDLRIIKGDGERGLFVAFPSRKQSTGEYKDVCHPINKETRQLFEDVILKKFNDEV